MPTGIWFPAVRANTGADVFTEQLAAGLEKMGFKVAIDWLPLRAEYAPWAVGLPAPPEWAEIAQVNSWLATRFIPQKLKVVSTIHHSIHDPRLRAYKGLARTMYHEYWIRRLERRNLARANAIVAVSSDAARWAKHMLGALDVRVIHNGIDLRATALMERLGPNLPFRLIYLGNWKSLKGVALFPEIMRQLGDQFELLCIGGKPADASRHEFPGNIHLLGRITDRRELFRQLQRADAFLFPSLSEGFGLALVEAMACGLPAIAAKCSSAPEVVSDGISGILCPSDDVAAFVAAVRWLAADSDAWLRMREAARARAVNAFDLDLQIREYAILYEQLADKVAG